MCCSLKSEFHWGEDESHDPTLKRRQQKTHARSCVGWYAVAPIFTFESRRLTCGGTQTERRPAVPELRNSVPIDASLRTRALLIRLTWGVRDFIFARSGQ